MTLGFEGEGCGGDVEFVIVLISKLIYTRADEVDAEKWIVTGPRRDGCAVGRKVCLGALMPKAASIISTNTKGIFGSHIKRSKFV